jgi:hypothetical protein
MAKTFEQRLDEALRLDDPPPAYFSAMEDRLTKIADFLQSQIDPSKRKAQVVVEPGHLINAGQQLNVVIHIPARNSYRDTLFRAYIPAAGTPVTLDFIGDSPEEVNTPDALEESVILFLSREQIRLMIRTLREIASKVP